MAATTSPVRSPAINEQQVPTFLESLFGEELHAKRVLSLSLATLPGPVEPSRLQAGLMRL